MLGPYVVISMLDLIIHHNKWKDQKILSYVDLIRILTELELRVYESDEEI